MKTKDLIIAVLAVLVLTLSILYVNKGSENTEKTRSIGECQVLPSDKCCVDITDRIDDLPINEYCDSSGNQFGSSFPEDSLDKMIGYIRDGKSINEYDQIYGFQIGIDFINELSGAISKFDSINNANETGLKINGLRFYEAVSTRPINGKLSRKADLVLVPYDNNGDDIFEVDKPHFLRNDLKMYTHFRPCPRICGSETLFGKEKKD